MASRQIGFVSEENKQTTYDLLTSATLNDNPEVSGEVSERVVAVGLGPVSHEARQIGRELGLELASKTELISSRLCGEELRQEQEQAWKRVWETCLEVIEVLFSDPKLQNDESLSMIDDNLCGDFDNAVENFIPMTTGDRSVPQNIETFLRCVLLAVSLVKHYKQNQTMGTRNEVLARVVLTIGSLLIRIGVHYGVYSWVTRTCWRSVRDAVHVYIVGTCNNSLESNIDFPIDDSRSIHLRWHSSRNVVFLAGVLVITYAYYRYHYS